MGRGTRIGILILVALAAAVVLLYGRGGDVTPPEAAAPAALPRLVDLGSKQCIPCKKMAPILEELEREYAGRMEVLFIDIREDRQAAADYGIRLIPTQIFFDAEGRELTRHEGFIDRAGILATWRDLGIEIGPGAAGAEG